MVKEIISYTDISTNTNIENIIFYNNTIWMTQTQMSKLYETDNSWISRHIKKIYADLELKEAETSQNESNLQKMQNTQKSFKKPKMYYNLQVVIAVWFKVNSPKALSFRIWANTIIEQYISKWYVLDDERLKWKWIISRKKAEEYVKKQMAKYQEKWWSLEAYIEWAEYLLSSDKNNFIS
jgi:hypothetical protein